MFAKFLPTIITPALVSIAACTPQDEREPRVEQTEGRAMGTTRNKSTTASAPILLETLSAADRRAATLEGELGCAFYASRGDEPLFLGVGAVDADAGAEGLVKVDGSARELAMDGSGGYDAMADGARFTGGDLSAAITVTGSAPLSEEPPIAGESPLYRAQLVVARADRSIRINGYYECGP